LTWSQSEKGLLLTKTRKTNFRGKRVRNARHLKEQGAGQLRIKESSNRSKSLTTSQRQ